MLYNNKMYILNNLTTTIYHRRVDSKTYAESMLLEWIVYYIIWTYRVNVIIALSLYTALDKLDIVNSRGGITKLAVHSRRCYYIH